MLQFIKDECSKILSGDVNRGARISLFILFYFILSVINAGNLAHLLAFVYIIYLLENFNESKNKRTD